MPKKAQVNQNRIIRKHLNERASSPYSVALDLVRNTVSTEVRVTRSRVHEAIRDFVPTLDSPVPISAACLSFNSPALELSNLESSASSNIISTQNPESSTSSNIISIQDTTTSEVSSDKHSTLLVDESINLLDESWSKLSPVIKKIVEKSTVSAGVDLTKQRIEETRISEFNSTCLLGHSDTTEPLIDIAPVVQQFIESFNTNTSSDSSNSSDFHSVIQATPNPIALRDLEKNFSVQNIVNQFEKGLVVIEPANVEKNYQFGDQEIKVVNKDISLSRE